MQMDSYFFPGGFHDDAPFYPHAAMAVPPSPELPFGLIASPEEPAPPFVPPIPAAFHDYYGATPELILPTVEQGAPPHVSGVHTPGIDALGRMGSCLGGLEQDQTTTMEEDESPRRRQQPAAAVESSRGFRHMMRERQRREKLSQSYADLYAMVAARSKGDKNSIVQSAAVYIHELKGAREQLRRRNEELKARILGHDAAQQCVTVQFEVDDPAAAPLDSMIGALKRLRSMDVRARGIRSTMSGCRLRTEMNVETTIAAAEVEKAVEEALMQEVERNQQQQAAEAGSGGPGFPGTSSPSSGGRGWGPQASSHVQNVF